MFSIQVATNPLQRSSNSKDNNQDRKLLPLRELPERKNIVTKARSAQQQSKDSSKEDGDSTGTDTSKIQAKKLLLSTAKKGHISISSLSPTAKTSSTSTSLPSTSINMSGIDPKLENVLNN